MCRKVYLTQSIGDNGQDGGVRNVLFDTIGQRIRKLRLRKDMSITELSAHLGISRQHLSAVEHGKTEVGLLALQAIASELGTSMSALLKGL
jgi:transcriptional regulator with XRE-family HTH domain